MSDEKLPIWIPSDDRINSSNVKKYLSFLSSNYRKTFSNYFLVKVIIHESSVNYNNRTDIDSSNNFCFYAIIIFKISKSIKE